MSLDSVADVDQTALGAGDGAADDDHVQLCINLNDFQILDGDLLIAHLAGADLAGEDTGLMGKQIFNKPDLSLCNFFDFL